jgi:excinuclease ABC subunit A
MRLMVPNDALTIAEGAIRPWSTASHRVGRQSWYLYQLRKVADSVGFSLHKPMRELSQDFRDVIFMGHEAESPLTAKLPRRYEGVVPNLLRRWKETESEHTRTEIEQYMVEKICPVCKGKRLRPEALAVKVLGTTIDVISEMSITELHGFLAKFFEGSKLSAAEVRVATPIVKEMKARVTFLLNVGLNYLTLIRSATTLSGGEAQRIRLATQIGSGLTGVVYILDEPSIGLHQRDQERLIETLNKLRELGNTVIVVEHDEQTIESADWVVDVGPGAGKHGGTIVFEGTPAELKKSDTLTGAYLSGRKRITVQSKRHAVTEKSPKLIIKGAAEHNLKNVTVAIPLEQFVCITGVSGSGKSTLMNDILARALQQHFYGSRALPGKFKRIIGRQYLDKVIVIDQSPIGRTPRSNPATYTGLFTPIRQLFATTKEAQLRGYKQGRFSFNVKGGRCEECEGQGVKKIEMHFLPDLYVDCEECHGTRYNKEALEITYKGKNIAEVLTMTIEEALAFFKNIPAIHRKLKTLNDVGLSYMELGQAATTLSGGEAQRVKLATELAKKDTGHTLYILDEPTTGLHFEDIYKLLNVLHRLKNKGNTVLVIEHNLDVIKTADWIIDLGPEGGDKGGRVVAEGSPREVAKSRTSYTGQFLKKMKA